MKSIANRPGQEATCRIMPPIIMDKEACFDFAVSDASHVVYERHV